ncbi:histone lysine acetyltransferase CREBBP-like [Tachypleus tridentatus]|uniref:histone lysine acetyltransferase CREBBP-like n=1 Tax=Tachypleus tridentatus TaxID=6853 RepID=UPI003FD3BDB8
MMCTVTCSSTTIQSISKMDSPSITSVPALSLQVTTPASLEIKMEVDTTEIKEGKAEIKQDSKTPQCEKGMKVETKQEPADDSSTAGYVKSECFTTRKEGPVSVKVELSTPAASTNDGELPTLASDVKPDVSEAAQPPPKPKPNKKVFKPDELRQALMPTLEKLYRQDPESLPFRQPVDPQLLQIPQWIYRLLNEKLDTGQYQDPWQYVDDLWLMFDNAWLYNRKTSRVYRYCTKLAEVFEQEIDPVMQSLGYCCGRKYVFQPQVLCCYGKQLCTIPRDAKYWSYQNRYTYCQRCFAEIQGDTVTLGDDPTAPQTTIPKDQFEELKNDHLELEPHVLPYL